MKCSTRKHPVWIVLLIALTGSVLLTGHTLANLQQPASESPATNEEKVMNVHYLEIVTPEMDATCQALEKMHGVKFGDPVAEYGGARTAPLKNGGRLGVRAPMHEAETPVVRPYVLVNDIEAAVESAKEAGGEIAMPPTEIPGEGRFAIYFHGGIQHGLWEK
ncbi:MAG: VOC family protein [Phycisphaerales bacterium]